MANKETTPGAASPAECAKAVEGARKASEAKAQAKAAATKAPVTAEVKTGEGK